MASQHASGAPTHPVDLPRICRHLKTKGLYLDGLDDPDMHRTGPEARYWCLQSMQSFGPDGDFVCPEDCDPNRTCFRDE